MHTKVYIMWFKVRSGDRSWDFWFIEGHVSRTKLYLDNAPSILSVIHTKYYSIIPRVKVCLWTLVMLLFCIQKE